MCSSVCRSIARARSFDGSLAIGCRAMPSIDLGLKPSLCTYHFRVQPDELPPETALHKAEDGDDALLAMMDTQGELASQKLKMGEVRMAIRILHQAYAMVESYTESFPSSEPIPPAAMLAASSIRLALCVVLSGMGRHPQALDEAKMAAVEMDKVWRLLFAASAEQEAATAEGDKLRPAASIRNALRNPPQWLERAVQTSVQARHCIAVELEFIQPLPPPGGWPSDTSVEDAAALASFLAPDDDDDEYQEPTSVQEHTVSKVSFAEPGASVFLEASQDDGEVPDPVPVSELLTVQEQIGKLHREGVMLARQLLPERHPVRRRAELVLTEWQQRTGGDGQPGLSPSNCPTRGMSRKKAMSMEIFGSHALGPEPVPSLGLLSSDGNSLPSMNQSQMRGCSSGPTLSASSNDGQRCRMPSTDQSNPSLPCISRLMATKRLPPARSASTTSMQARTTSTTSVGSADHLFSLSQMSTDVRDLSQKLSTSQYLAQVSMTNAREVPGGDVYIASKPKSRKVDPQAAKKKAEEAKKKVASEEEAADGSTKPVISKTLQQRQEEAAIALALKDPFEDWRKNMVSRNQMSGFQQKLQSIAGLSSLQVGLKDESRKFRCFEMGEMDDDAQFSNRTLFCPSGMTIQNAKKKQVEAFKKQHWEITEDGQDKRSTKKHLFKYFGHEVKEDPGVKDLSKLLSKSQTHGANLERISKIEEKRGLIARGEKVSDELHKAAQHPVAEEKHQLSGLAAFLNKG